MTVESAIARSVLAEQVKEPPSGDPRRPLPADSRIVETRSRASWASARLPSAGAAWPRGARGRRDHAVPGRPGASTNGSPAQEAYIVRSELEALGARLAVPHISDDALDGLAGLVDEMHAAARQRRPACGRDRRPSFHARIIEIGGTPPWPGLAVARAVLEDVHHANRPGPDAQWTADLHTPSCGPCAPATPKLLSWRSATTLPRRAPALERNGAIRRRCPRLSRLARPSPDALAPANVWVSDASAEADTWRPADSCHADHVMPT